MTFLSFYWFAWMVGTISIYWILPSRYRDWFLAIVSFSFLLVTDWVSTTLLAIFTVISYSAANRKKAAPYLILVAALLVVAVLGFYKIRVQNAPFDVIRDVAMPLGLSYYAFRVIHYLIERYRDSLPPHGFADYVSYLFFLPTLVVGPIHRFPTFVDGRRNNVWSVDDISLGMERILIGYFKVVVLGNFLMSKWFAGYIGGLDESMAPLILYLDAVRGSFNLYFQFAGYSEIAIGFAMMLGYRVMENFNWPFLSVNIAEFWRSWHISLTSWSRDYIYMPVVGLTRNPILGTLASLLVIGIWHEMSPRYIVWGLYHGLGIVFVNKLQKWKRKNGIRPAKSVYLRRIVDGFSVILTANYFFFGYVIINQSQLTEIWRAYWIILFSWWLGGA